MEAEHDRGALGGHCEARIDPVRLEKTTIYRKPFAFIDKSGKPIVIMPLRESRHEELLEMYLAYKRRDQFSGLPPIREEERVQWVEGMIGNGVNLIAFCFDLGVIGHTALFPMDHETCELVIALDERHRNVGIGTQLTRELLKLAHELEFERMWLNVDITNRIAQHVYTKNGFRCVARDDRDGIEMAADLSYLSRLEDVAVHEVMDAPVISINENATCRDALNLIVNERVGALPVLDGIGRMVGILSEADLLGAGCLDLLSKNVSTKQVVFTRGESRLSDLVRLFQARRLRCIPVIDEHGRPIGMVGRREILARYVRNSDTAHP